MDDNTQPSKPTRPRTSRPPIPPPLKRTQQEAEIQSPQPTHPTSSSTSATGRIPRTISALGTMAPPTTATTHTTQTNPPASDVADDHWTTATSDAALGPSANIFSPIARESDMSPSFRANTPTHQSTVPPILSTPDKGKARESLTQTILSPTLFETPRASHASKRTREKSPQSPTVSRSVSRSSSIHDAPDNIVERLPRLYEQFRTEASTQFPFGPPHPLLDSESHLTYDLRAKSMKWFSLVDDTREMLNAYASTLSPRKFTLPMQVQLHLILASAQAAITRAREDFIQGTNPFIQGSLLHAISREATRDIGFPPTFIHSWEEFDKHGANMPVFPPPDLSEEQGMGANEMEADEEPSFPFISAQPIIPSAAQQLRLRQQAQRNELLLSSLRQLTHPNPTHPTQPSIPLMQHEHTGPLTTTASTSAHPSGLPAPTGEPALGTLPDGGPGSGAVPGVPAFNNPGRFPLINTGIPAGPTAPTTARGRRRNRRGQPTRPNTPIATNGATRGIPGMGIQSELTTSSAQRVGPRGITPPHIQDRNRILAATGRNSATTSTIPTSSNTFIAGGAVTTTEAQLSNAIASKFFAVRTAEDLAFVYTHLPTLLSSGVSLRGLDTAGPFPAVAPPINLATHPGRSGQTAQTQNPTGTSKRSQQRARRAAANANVGSAVPGNAGPSYSNAAAGLPSGRASLANPQQRLVNPGRLPLPAVPPPSFASSDPTFIVRYRARDAPPADLAVPNKGIGEDERNVTTVAIYAAITQAILATPTASATVRKVSWTEAGNLSISFARGQSRPLLEATVAAWSPTLPYQDRIINVDWNMPWSFFVISGVPTGINISHRRQQDGTEYNVAYGTLTPTDALLPAIRLYGPLETATFTVAPRWTVEEDIRQTLTRSSVKFAIEDPTGSITTRAIQHRAQLRMFAAQVSLHQDIPLPPLTQCEKCWKFYHLASSCRARVVCNHCGKEHAEADHRANCLHCHAEARPADQACPHPTICTHCPADKQDGHKSSNLLCPAKKAARIAQRDNNIRANPRRR